MGLAPEEKLIVVTIPAYNALGDSEKDFSGVTTHAVDLEGKLTEVTSHVFFPASGRLGTLHGGLLFLNDFRSVLSKEDITNLAVKTTEQGLLKKRMGLGTNRKFCSR